MLKYKIITTKQQYLEYCNTLETLVFSNSKTKSIKEEIDLLTLLIEDYDAKHSKLVELNPIEILKSLKKEHSLKIANLSTILNINFKEVRKILNCERMISKDEIKLLSTFFKIDKKAFNKKYRLVTDINYYEEANTKEKIVSLTGYLRFEYEKLMNENQDHYLNQVWKDHFSYWLNNHILLTESFGGGACGYLFETKKEANEHISYLKKSIKALENDKELLKL